MAGWDAFRFLLCLRHLGKIMYGVVVSVVGLSWYAVMRACSSEVGRGGGIAMLNLGGAVAFNFLVRAPARLLRCRHHVYNVLSNYRWADAPQINGGRMPLIGGFMGLR